MQLQLIRNATLRLKYNNQIFVIDPYLAPKHSYPSYANRSKNPTVELPLPASEVLAGAEMIIVSHLHTDHFDPAAQNLIPKETLIYCQPGDASKIGKIGFQHVEPIEDEVSWRGITIQRTLGLHGQGEVLDLMGNVSGFVFAAEGEPTVYWAGDTVLCEAVQTVVAAVQPDIIITHSCGAVWQNYGLILMDADQTVALCQYSPNSIVVATHMEAVDHATVSRAALRAAAEAAAISAERLRIPADGETLSF